MGVGWITVLVLSVIIGRCMMCVMNRGRHVIRGV
jgi:hypothetical protein